MPIAKESLGRAGQPGYVIHAGDEVEVVPADNLPGGGYFIVNVETGDSIFIDPDELDEFVE